MDSELNQNSYRNDRANGNRVDDQHFVSNLYGDNRGHDQDEAKEFSSGGDSHNFFPKDGQSQLGQHQTDLSSADTIALSFNYEDMSRSKHIDEDLDTSGQSILPTALENNQKADSFEFPTNLETPKVASNVGSPAFETELPSRNTENRFLYNDIGQIDSVGDTNYSESPSFTINSIKELRPKISNGRTVKWWPIAILAAITFLAGSVSATEMGLITGLDKYYNMVGLEKFWGGMPGDGKAAIASSALKMEKINSTHYESETLIEATSGEDMLSPLQSLINKKAKFALAPNAFGRILGTTTADVPSTSDDKITANVKIIGDYSPDKMQAKITYESPLINQGLSYYGVSGSNSSSFEVDIRATKDKAYLRIPILSILYGSKNNKWLEFEKDDVDTYINQFSEENSNPTKKLDDLKKLFRSSRRVGYEKIGSIATAKYQAEVDIYQLSLLVGRSKKAANEIMQYKPEVVVYYWIGTKDYLTYKVSATIKASYEKSKITIDSNTFLTKFDESFEVEIPKDEEVDTNGLMGLINGFGSGATSLSNQAAANDAMRKSDLRSYKSALAMYQSDSGKYPISASVCNIGSADCKVLNVLTEGGYIHILPTDPVEGRYYGYKCTDGKNFELTSQLENTNDTGEGVTNENGLLIYILRND